MVFGQAQVVRLGRAGFSKNRGRCCYAASAAVGIISKTLKIIWRRKATSAGCRDGKGLVPV